MNFRKCSRCQGTGLRLERIHEEKEDMLQLNCLLCAARYDQLSLINNMKFYGSDTKAWMYIALSKIHEDIRVLSEKEM